MVLLAVRGALVAEDAIGGGRDALSTGARAVHQVDVDLEQAMRVAPACNSVCRRAEYGHLQAPSRGAPPVHEVDVSGQLMHCAVCGHA